MESIRFRPLNAGDAEQLRDLRFMAVKSEVVFSFTVNLKVESSRSLSQWAEMTKETDTQIFFGAFHNDRLIGMVGAKPWAKDETENTCHWYSTYLCPEYRKLGIAQRLYRLREEWTISKGFKKAIFSLHAENERAIAIHNAQGAHEFDRELIYFGENNEKKAYALWHYRVFSDSSIPQF